MRSTRIAEDLGQLYADLARSREETTRVKDALREWQSQQAAVRHQPVPR